MKKILIIEDDNTVQEHIEISLDKLAQIKLSSSIHEAKKIIQEESFDLIVCDKNLPDGDGVRFAHELRDSKINIPIIFLTGEMSIDAKVEGLSLGEDYLLKPFHPRELRIKVQKYLK